MMLSSALPTPVIAPVPVITSFSIFDVKLKETDAITVSNPPAALTSVARSPMLEAM